MKGRRCHCRATVSAFSRLTSALPCLLPVTNDHYHETKFRERAGASKFSTNGERLVSAATPPTLLWRYQHCHRPRHDQGAQGKTRSERQIRVDRHLRKAGRRVESGRIARDTGPERIKTGGHHLTHRSRWIGVQKIHERLSSFLWALFQDPVACILQHHDRDIGRNQFHLLCELVPIGLVATDR